MKNNGTGFVKLTSQHLVSPIGVDQLWIAGCGFNFKTLQGDSGNRGFVSNNLRLPMKLVDNVCSICIPQRRSIRTTVLENEEFVFRTEMNKSQVRNLKSVLSLKCSNQLLNESLSLAKRVSLFL